MNTKKLTKLLALYLPYILLGLVATNFGEAWRLAEGKELGERIMSMMGTLPAAFANPLPSLHPLDLLIGISCGAGLRLAVYLRSKNAKKYRHGMEYGSARWGTAKDIEPFQAPKFEDNIILTKTERLMMSNRPSDPKNARNKNVLIVGGSGSGKTRFWLKPNLLQMHSSYVVTDPKGSIVVECGNALLKNGYKLKILNTINFSKSMDLDVQVAKLKVLKADHQSQKFRLEDKLLTKFPAEIQEQTAKIAALKSDAEIAAAHPQDKENFCGMVIKGMTYDEKKTAGERLILACMELPNTEEQVVGSYRGFELSLRFDTFHNEHQALLKGTLKYPVPLGSDPHGNIVRLDNALSNFADRSTAAENELDTLRQQQAAAQVEVAKPFPQEEELAQKSARLAELNAQLDVDEKHHEPEQDEEEKEDAPRRSVLAVLEEKAEKAEPVKPFKSYLDKDGDAR